MTKYFAITFLVAVATMSAVTPADARGGCGIDATVACWAPATTMPLP